ncbi:hypothetical protein ASE85_02500 [Sphingobium sp. Leaf26]|uniref:hypothetical protein n=1 Tax=Sphingobium sp. Leaf26 TaxID=1735693 RepID=UPI0006F64E64|nr:hypothetical protein [Sphingobium sp. Leaf26]KQN09824.1 hypothetical protein ASE85_02500 [Sphingobium sp. Leaf26]
MPRIPQYGGPTAGPVQTTSARFRPADNNGGAAAGVARGLQQLGRVGADAAMVQAKINDDLARTNADNLYLNASTAANGAVNDLKSKMGKGALDYRPDAGKAVEDALNATLAQADPHTRRYLEPQLARLRMSADSEMASYAVQQGRVYQQETGKAKVENSFQMAVATDDPAKRAGFIQEVRDQTRANLEMAGLNDPDIIENEERKAVSTAHTAIAGRYMAAKDYDLADAYYQANRGNMTVGDQASLSASLAGPMMKRWAETQFTALTSLPSIGAEPGKGGSGNPVADGGAAIKGLFPGAVITSTYRAPDHPLSKANPKSWHTKSHAAVDVKPIAGMSFDQYVKQVEGAGYTVLEAINEVGAGRSKHATGDHWHIVLGKGGGGPAPSAKRWDLEATTQSIYARAEKEGWSPEQRDAVLDVAKGHIGLADQMRQRKEEDASDAALKWVLTKGDSFTDLSQMPASIRNSLSPEAQTTFTTRAKANSTGGGVKSDSIYAMRLHAIQHGKPDEFLNLDLTEYVNKVTSAELDAAVTDQARLRGPGGDKILQSRSAVSTAIGVYTDRDPAMAKLLDKKKEPAAFARVAQDMERYITSITGGKREPTGAEMDAAWRRAIMPVATPGGWFGSKKDVPRFKVDGTYQVTVPIAVRERIIRTWRDKHGGQMPPDGVIGDLYIQGKGRPGFWE